MIKKIIILTAFFTVCSLGFSQSAADGSDNPAPTSIAPNSIGHADNAAQATEDDKKPAKKKACKSKKKACTKKKKRCCSKKKACHKKKN